MSTSDQRALILQGEAFIQNGQYDEAQAAFLEVLREDPDQVDALNNLGILAIQAGDEAGALEAFLRGLRADPDHEVLGENIQTLVEAPGLRERAHAYLRDVLGAGRLGPRDRRFARLLSRLLGAPGAYRAAYRAISITPGGLPAARVALQGFATEAPRLADQALTPLHLQLLLVEDEHGSRLLFVAADLFGFDEVMVERVRAVAAPWGLPPEAIVLNASHTHYAPGTVRNVPPVLGQFDEGYAAQIVNAIGQVLPALYERLEPCLVWAGHTEVQIGVNRRQRVDGAIQFGVHPEGYYHQTTPVLGLDFIPSARALLLVNHACHPTGLSAAPVLSADFPGFLRAFLTKARVASDVLFLQGAAGSAKMSRIDEAGQVRFTQRPEEVVRQSQHLAQAVADLIEGELEPVRGNVFARIERVRLPFQPAPDTEAFTELAQSPQRSALVRQWAAHFAGMPEAERPKDLPLEVQLVALGERTGFLTFPGEPVAELARTLIARAGLAPGTFVLGYTNGLRAYLPTAEMIAEGGYEADESKTVYLLPAPFAPEAEDRLADAVVAGVAAWRGQTDGYGRYHRVPAGRAFFCLSSGRCGTQTLAHLLGMATNARVYHHPQPYLVEETLAAYDGALDLADTFWRARGSVVRDAWKDGLVFGELDHNMTPFTPMLAGEIPASKFLVLVRNPWDFVRSGMRRGYYVNHGWDKGRLRPAPGHPDAMRWGAMTPFEKVCWLWNETYARIEQYLAGIPADRYRIVRFEDLTTDPGVCREIFEFLGLDGFDADRTAEILAEPLNRQTGGSFPEPGQWSPEQHQTLWNRCGDRIARFGYAAYRQRYAGAPAAGAPLLQMAAPPPLRRRKRLLFLEQKGISTGGHLDHIHRVLQEAYDVRFLKTADLNEAAAAVGEADLVWLEWASPLTAAATRKIAALREKPVVCRLHGFEVYTDVPKQIDWSVVDRLVFVADHKQALFNEKFPQARVEQAVIRNGVDASRFSVAPGKTNTKNLLLLGHLNYRKGLPMLLQFYHELLKRDSAYHLYIRGDWQDERYKRSVFTMIGELNLRDKITFEERWIDDLNAWLADKSHILSFSLEESFHYAIGNGMAAGMKPVIHAWDESRAIWPGQFIFRNLDEFLQLMADPAYTPDAYRALLSAHHLTAETQLGKIGALLAELLEQPARPRGTVERLKAVSY